MLLLFSLTVKVARAEEGLFIRDLVGYPKLPHIIDNWRRVPFGKYSCYRDLGRAFSVTLNEPLSFEAISLSGISVMIFSSKRLADEDWQLFRLTLLKGSPDNFTGKDLSKTVGEGSVGAVTEVSIFPNYKSTYVGTYNYTYEILFRFSPVLIKKAQDYTAIFECRTDQGFISVWESSRLFPIGKAYLFDGSSIKPYLTDTGIQHSLYGVRALVFRPVLLVPDLGGVFQDFYMYGYDTLLSGESFNSKFVKFFDMGSSGYRDFADLRDVNLGRKLAEDIKLLSSNYALEGGDGKIDVVAFGLGNLLVKDYLAKNKDKSFMRRFISVGSPHQGSWLVDKENDSDSSDSYRQVYNSKAIEVLLPELRDLNLLSSGQDPEALRSFIDQASSSSEMIKELSDNKNLPSGEQVLYYDIAGNVDVSIEQLLFGEKVSSLSSIGDGAVSLESSRSLCEGAGDHCQTTFTEKINVIRKITKDSSGAGVSYSLPDLASLKFLHHRLIKADEVKNKIKEVLVDR